MPNTKSAERRMRGNERKRQHNKTVESRLKTVEKRYTQLLAAGKKDEAQAAYNLVASSYDKAAKSGVIHKGAADRKKSRLSSRLNRVAAAAAPAAS
jgi:small subunit ribosomal protein S20